MKVYEGAVSIMENEGGYCSASIIVDGEDLADLIAVDFGGHNNTPRAAGIVECGRLRITVEIVNG